MIVDQEGAPVPQAAAWIGGLGLLPFLGLAFLIPLSNDALRPQFAFALVAYGATILSFLGGINWGLAIAAAGSSDVGHGLLRRLVASVIPSLFAWVSLLVSLRLGWLLLAIAFGIMLLVDTRASKLGQAPAWYPRLRLPLSFAAIAALVLGGLA